MKKIIKRTAIILFLLILCSTSVFVAKEYYELKQPGVIVLLYHKISRKADGTNKYVLHINEFKQQINYLKREGYSTILPREIIESNIALNNYKVVILSFDDGTADHFETVYPVLKKYGFKGIFFIISKYVNSPGSLTENQIREMSHNNMEIGSHSHSHPFLDELHYNHIDFELKKSKDDLEEIIGTEVASFAPPGGWFNEDVLRAAKDVGYKTLFSCEIGTNDLNKNPYIYKRIEVLGDMTLEDFECLLHPSKALGYKLEQSVKFLLHDLLGSNNYRRLGKLLK